MHPGRDDDDVNALLGGTTYMGPGTGVLLTRSLWSTFLKDSAIVSSICQSETRVDAICEREGLGPADVFFEHQC